MRPPSVELQEETTGGHIPHIMCNSKSASKYLFRNSGRNLTAK